MACSSERGLGIAGITGIVAFTVVATMAAAITEAGTSAGVAGTMTIFEAEDSIMKALGVAAASMVEVSSTATVAGFMVAAAAGMVVTDNLRGLGI